MGYNLGFVFAAGPPDQEGVAPEKRQGPLWDAYRALSQEGWAVDARSYSTAFRVKPTPGKSFDELQVPLAPVPCGGAWWQWRQCA